MPNELQCKLHPRRQKCLIRVGASGESQSVIDCKAWKIKLRRPVLLRGFKHTGTQWLVSKLSRAWWKLLPSVALCSVVAAGLWLTWHGCSALGWAAAVLFLCSSLSALSDNMGSILSQALTPESIFAAALSPHLLSASACSPDHG